jgi:hypothetical protein
MTDWWAAMTPKAFHPGAVKTSLVGAGKDARLSLASWRKMVLALNSMSSAGAPFPSGKEWLDMEMR